MPSEIRVTSPTGDAIDALVTAEEMHRNGSPRWTDATTPRTDRPVRFLAWVQRPAFPNAYRVFSRIA